MSAVTYYMGSEDGEWVDVTDLVSHPRVFSGRVVPDDDPTPGQGIVETQSAPAGGTCPSEPIQHAQPELPAARADALLLLYADLLDDLEKVRIATENRVRALGMEGLEGSPEQERLAGLTEALHVQEHAAELELRRALRKHPLGPWVKATAGIGEKQGARLLAAIGNPATRRTVSQLWAYCGYHVLNPGRSRTDAQIRPAGVHSLHPHQRKDEPQLEIVGVDPSSDPGRASDDTQKELAGVAPKRRKGQRANWNGTAKTRAYLCAVSCVKQARSPFRAVYDARRAHTAVTHPEWTPGHSHNDALRVTAKEILKALWVEAKRLEGA